MYIHTYRHTYHYITFLDVTLDYITYVETCPTHHEISFALGRFRWDQKDASGQCGLMEKDMDYATWQRWAHLGWMELKTYPRKHDNLSD